MENKLVRCTQLDVVGSENLECLSKMPPATAEQLNIAKILTKSSDDIDLRHRVQQLRELTECTEDQAVTALYDCENNLDRAVELILDRHRCDQQEEWHTSGKKIRQKHSDNVSEIGSTDCRRTAKDVLSKEPKNNVAVNGIRSGRVNTNGPALRRKPKQSTFDHDNHSMAFQRNKTFSHVPRQKVSDGWDPYTQYGEWGGVAIEVVNSNVPIFNEEPQYPSELFLETDSRAKPASETPVPDNVASPIVDLPSKMNAITANESIFIPKAHSRPPPPAFTNMPNIPVFVAPTLYKKPTSRHVFKFGGSPPAVLVPHKSVASPGVHLDSQTKSTHVTTSIHPYVVAPTKHTAPEYDQKIRPRGVLSHTEESIKAGDSYVASQYQSVAGGPKMVTAFPNVQKSQPNVALADVSPTRSGYIDPSFKNMLDSLPTEMSKLSTASSTCKSYTHKPTHAQTDAFTHSQPVHAVQQIPKSLPSHNSSHGPIHMSQTTTASSVSQAQHALPPGMPHFISQYPQPAFHMFNIPGGTSNAPALFDLEQLQLLQQQQRMFYDMQLQQAATTVQSMITSGADSPSTGKSTHASGSLSHVSVASPAIRPDVLAPTVGHPAQMMTTSHPYFPYPGFVVMNGYPNPYMNQQDGAVATTVHSGSVSQAPHVTTPAQSYSAMKMPVGGVLTYEDMFDMKYGDPSKQVGFKPNPQPGGYAPYPGQVLTSDGAKMPTGSHTASGILGQSYGASVGGAGGPQPFPAQFYPTGPQQYFSAAVAVAAAAAAATAQAAVGANAAPVNQSNAIGNSSVSNQVTSIATGPGQVHLANANQALLMGSSGHGLHHPHTHQRPVMAHQH